MKLRRTMMFVPGNNPGMLINAGIYGADTIIFDLEDSVALSEKDAARHLVYNAMKSINYPCEVAVRINHISTPFGYKDLETILAVKPDLIRLPKAETAADIKEIDELITAAEIKHGFLPGSINMMAAIETAKGIRNAYDIAAASPRMVALAIGGEDYLADIQTSRTKDGKEFFAGRGQLILAAKEAGIHAIDTVFGDVNNEEDFIAETTRIKEMGFDGKSVVNPRQINIVHEIYTPTEKEIDHAQRVIAAYEESLARKSGVVSLNGKMIDIPVVKRAQRTLAYANAVGKYKGGETL